jgi:hypothetical protein
MRIGPSTGNSSIRSHLADDGVIVLQENNRGSTVATFREMIAAADLEILFTHGDHKELTKNSEFYFIGMAKKGANSPDWATGAG